MFGVDLGITVSSISLVTAKYKILDFQILFGDRKDKIEWRRITQMSDAIVDNIVVMCKARPGTIINPWVSIEEPVYPYRTKNPRSFFIMSCLYALVRNKLVKRNFEIHSINPVSVKATAKAHAFKGKQLGEQYMKRGRLTKKGMIKAFRKVVGYKPEFHTIVGRETLADSFFIALTGIDRRKVGIND